MHYIHSAERKVCQKDLMKKKKKKKGGEQKVIPFPTLDPGDLFSTEFGIVEVIGDNRIPEDHGTTKVGAKELQLSKNWKRKKFAIERKKKLLLANGESIAHLEEIGDDPLIPRDSYPDRIVECRELVDARVKKTDIDVESERVDGDVGLTKRARQIVAETRESLKHGKASPEKTCPVAKSKPAQKYTGTKMFLKRRVLTKHYIADAIIYCCSVCGKNDFSSIPSLEYHMERHKPIMEDPVLAEESSGAEEEEAAANGRRRTSKRKAARKATKKNKSPLMLEETTKVDPAEAKTDNTVPDASKQKNRAKRDNDNLASTHSATGSDNCESALSRCAVKEEDVEEYTPESEPRKKRRYVQLTKKRPEEVVNLQELVDECNTGRYFSIVKYTGEHDTTCRLCKEGGDLLKCEFCHQTNHMACMKREMDIAPWAPNEDFMCTNCIRTVLGRRRRANRRLEKARVLREKRLELERQLRERADTGDEEAQRELDKLAKQPVRSPRPYVPRCQRKPPPAKNPIPGDFPEPDISGLTVFPDPLAQLSKPSPTTADFQNKQSWPRLRERPTDISKFPLDLSAGGINSLSAGGMSSPGTDIAWNPNNAVSYFDENVGLSAPQCPKGGPGGLVCCEACTVSYALYLNQTTSEMDAHNVSKVGEEVNELLELLQDSQKRLKAAVDMAQEHEVQRGVMHERIENGSLNLSNTVPAVTGEVSTTPSLPVFPMGDMGTQLSPAAFATTNIELDLPIENETIDLTDKGDEKAPDAGPTFEAVGESVLTNFASI